MKISLLQNNITWAAPVNNHKHIEQLLSKADVADLYVLPEMFSKRSLVTQSRSNSRAKLKAFPSMTFSM